MSGDSRSIVLIRGYEELDRSQIESFVCVFAQKWRRVAQDVIQESPEECENGNVEILVAVEQSKILGVIVFRQSPTENPKWEICSMGVLLDRQNEGIGLRLKEAVIAEVVSRKGTAEFISTVHKLNREMRAINSRLEAVTRKDPDDGEYLLTLVRAEASH